MQVNLRTGPAHSNHLVEWLLFMLVAIITLHEAWLIGEGNTHEFFWGSWDGMGYYQWLPSAFVSGEFERMFWTYEMAPDRWISLFSLGVAVLQLPFFLLGQLMSWFFDYPLNGFSPANAVSMMTASAVYAGAGAVLAFRLAREFSSTTSSLLSVVAIYAGSNLIYYGTHTPLMSHIYSFFLIGLFCWCTIRTIKGPKGYEVLLFVLSGSLLVLIRQLNIVVFLFPIYMAYFSPGGLRGAWRNLTRNRLLLSVSVGLAVVPWVLQGLYWHHITGAWYANGYAFKGEFFHWDKMVPGMVLFSPRNGWLAYSPIFLAAMVTLVVHVWRNTRPARVLLLIVALVVIIYSAWWCWWLGGAYGFRGMVDFYALLAIPMAWFFRSVLRRPLALRVFAALLMIALIRLNFGMIEHYDYWLYCERAEWPPLLEVIGNIAAGR